LYRTRSNEDTIDGKKSNQYKRHTCYHNVATGPKDFIHVAIMSGNEI
jgi:hypothetical protein